MPDKKYHSGVVLFAYLRIIYYSTISKFVLALGFDISRIF